MPNEKERRNFCADYERLMRELGMAGQVTAKKHRMTNSQHGFPRYANLLEQLEIVRASSGLGQ